MVEDGGIGDADFLDGAGGTWQEGQNDQGDGTEDAKDDGDERRERVD
jgi:hypothetical protein